MFILFQFEEGQGCKDFAVIYPVPCYQHIMPGNQGKFILEIYTPLHGLIPSLFKTRNRKMGIVFRDRICLTGRKADKPLAG